MKHLKLFETSTQYESYKSSSDFVLPNVSLVTELGLVSYAPYVETLKANLCDIAYWDGSKVKTVSRYEWDSSLGTPVGVVVIPSGMLPDGKARIISLKYATSDGTYSDSSVKLNWGKSNFNTALTNYEKVPITDNAGSTSASSNATGFLPSNVFTGSTSFVDSKAKYNASSNLIPSPYLGDDSTLNPEYCKEILLGETNVNALSDFDGLSNTEHLVSLGSSYAAANAAYNYDGGVSGTGIKWYLPAAGELGFLMPRSRTINGVINDVGGVIPSGNLWSSSENSSISAYYLYTTTANMSHINKSSGLTRPSVRPFAII